MSIGKLEVLLLDITRFLFFILISTVEVKCIFFFFFTHLILYDAD